MADPKAGGGLNAAAVADRERSLGGETDLGGHGDDPLAAEPIAGGASAGLAGLDGGGIAVEAASLGAADGALADQAEAQADRAGRGGSGAADADRGTTSTARPGGDR